MATPNLLDTKIIYGGDKMKYVFSHEDQLLLNKLLYEIEDHRDCLQHITEIKNSHLLHYYAMHYNWDDGLEIPVAILNNKFCDLGTALLLFFCAEGELLLESKELLHNTNPIHDNKHSQFLTHLYDRIIQCDFRYKEIRFVGIESKVSRYKLLKKNPTVPSIFIEGSRGDTLTFE